MHASSNTPSQLIASKIIARLGMGKNYDNWERLVSAVARRERDRLLALASSVSSSSSQHGFSSTSQSLVPRDVDTSTLIPMEYSDLRLDQKEWKEMLPPDKREVVWRSLSMVAAYQVLSSKLYIIILSFFKRKERSYLTR